MKVAVIGASGLVGRRILEELSGKGYDIDGFCSKNSAGKVVSGIKLKRLSKLAIKRYDFAIFSAGSEVAKTYAPIFAKKGAFVIDNSNAFRREKNVPLVIPEVNGDVINEKTKIIANPNCSTTQVALALAAIDKVCKIKRVVVSTYQSASGAGKKGLDDLDNNKTNKFAYPLFDNLLPQIDIPLENGYTLEEDKIIFELKKILGRSDLKVTATAVRVPIHYCHGASVNVEFFENISLEKIKKALENASGIILRDDIKNLVYPLPLDAFDKREVFVGRLRRDFSTDNAINFWVVADNLRKGAATNTVQILEYIRRNL